MSKKVWFFITVFMIAALLTAVASEPVSASLSQLVMFRDNPRHSGVYAANGPQTLPAVLWQVQTGGKIVSSPAVTSDKVFFGSYDGYLYALNKTNGKTIWKYKTGDQVKSSPAVMDTTVYFASKDGFFYALNTSNGKLRWKFQTNDENTNYYELGIPWFTEGIDPAFYTGTGETRFSRINDPWDVFYSSPTIAGGLVYFGAYDGNVYALNTSTGKLVWKFQTGGPVRSTPAVAYQTVFVGSLDGYVYAIDARSGEEKWRSASVPGEWNTIHFQSSPAVENGTVFIGGRDSYLHAIDAFTGATKWVLAHDNGSWDIGSPAVKQGVVYEGSSDGLFIHAVDAQTGVETWRFPTLHNVFASPAITSDTLYIGDFNGYVFQDASFFYALNLKDGTEKWRFPTQGSVSSPVVDHGVVFFGTEDGILYALK